MAPEQEEVDAAREWLGAEHGGLELPDELVDILIVGFEADCWTSGEISLMEKISSSKAVRLFGAILRDSCNEAGETATDTTKIKFEMWIQGHFEDEDGDESKKKYVPSEEELKDLKRQGMTDWKEMRHGEFAQFMGRPGTDAEIEGGEYRTPPYQMQGVIKVAKISKSTGGLRTYETVLNDAIKSGKVDGVEKWITKVGFQLTARSTSKHTRPGSVLLDHWMNARRQLKEDRALIHYLKAVYEDYKGRFLPFPMGLAMDLIGEARDQYNSTSVITAMEEQLKESMAANAEMRREIQSLSSKVRQLQTDTRGSGGAGGSGVIKGPSGEPVVCHRCGENHYVSNCDKPKDFKKKESGKDKDD